MKIVDLRALFIVGLLDAVWAYNETEVCEIVPENTTFEHPSSCTKYYTCKGKKPIEAECLEGLFFDEKARRCVVQSNRNKCKKDIKSKCIGENSTFLPDPESCEKYYLCVLGKPLSLTCPKGGKFNPKTLVCDFDENFNCEKSSEKIYNICNILPRGRAFRDDTNCKNYKICFGNTPVEKTCPGNLWFNSAKGGCDTKINANCTQKENEVDVTEEPVIHHICGSRLRPYFGLVSDGKSCRGYYDCSISLVTNQTLNLTKQLPLKISPKFLQCNSSEIFDENTKKCQPSLYTQCRFDRCDGQDNEFVNINGDGCRGFAVCNKGKELLKMKCPFNYYFDERTQSCVDYVVDYPSCALSSEFM